MAGWISLSRHRLRRTEMSQGFISFAMMAAANSSIARA